MRFYFTLSCLCFLINFLSAQIPNGNFEVWEVIDGIEQPKYWEVYAGPKKIKGDKTEDAYEGNYALKILSWPGYEGYLPTRAVIYFQPDTIYESLNLFLRIDSIEAPGKVFVEVNEWMDGLFKKIGYWESVFSTDDFICVNIPLNQTEVNGLMIRIEALVSSGPLWSEGYAEFVVDKLELLMESPGLEFEVATVEPTCFGDEDGTINIHPSGGIPPYSFDWNNGSTDSVLTNIPAGAYQVFVIDANDSLQCLSVIVSQPPEIHLNLEVTDVSCFGEKDGMVIITPFFGNPPYTFNWDGGQMDSMLIELAPGEYEITVTDSHGCTATVSALIESPDEIVLEAEIIQSSVPESQDGAILIQHVMGGSSPFKYEWNTGEKTPSLTNIASGEYTLTVTDSDGCDAVFEFEVSFLSSVNHFEKAEMIVFPNPVSKSGEVHLTFPTLPTHELNIRIFDSMGRLRLRLSHPIQPEIRWQIPEEPAVFFIIMELENGKRWFEKLIVH